MVERRAAERRAERVGVEHPDVGAADARGGELRIERMFWPRCAVVMNARFRPGPANTMSRGSSPTRSVRTTRPR